MGCFGCLGYVWSYFILKYFRLQFRLTQNRMFIKIIEAFEQKLANGMTAAQNAFKNNNLA